MIKVGIIGRTRILLEAAKKVASYGFSVPFVYTCQPEKFYQCSEMDYREFANSIEADFFYDLKINTPERVAALKKYDCDVAISLNWLNILKEPICSAFRKGIWNAHAGDLPRYRGNACPNWAILNQESQVGLSLHEVVPNELDNGDVILKEYFNLYPET